MDGDGPTADVSLADGRLVTILLLSGVGLIGMEPIAAVLPTIASGLAVSDARVGLVLTAFFAGTAVAIPIVGTLADVYGRRPLVLGCLALFAAAGGATLLVDSFEVLLVLRVLQGAGMAGTTPLSIVITGDHYSGTAGSTVQGLRLSANGLSGILTPAAAGVLAGVAWNAPFVLYLVAIPIGVLAYVTLPAPSGRTDGATGIPVADRVRGYLAALWAEARDITVGVLIAGAGVAFFVRYGVLTFVPLYAVRALDATAVEAGLLVAVMGVARLVIAPLSGPLVGRVGRKPLVVATGVAIAVTAAVLPLAPSVPVLGGVLLGYGAASVILVPILNDSVAALASDDTRGGLVSGMNSFKNVSMALAPAVFGGVLAVSGFPAVFYGVAGVALAYAALALVAIDAGTLARH